LLVTNHPIFSLKVIKRNEIIVAGETFLICGQIKNNKFYKNKNEEITASTTIN
jgi:hypothetical protein